MSISFVEVNSLRNETANSLSLLTMLTGAMTGDPHSLWSMFETNGNARQGKLYYDNKSGAYFMADQISDLVNFSTYKDYAWDDEQKKYVGTVLIGTYEYYKTKDG